MRGEPGVVVGGVLVLGEPGVVEPGVLGMVRGEPGVVV